MIDHAEHYEPTPRAAAAIGAAWIAAGLCVLAARRIHTHRRRVATALAFAASAFAGWHARGVGPVTVGAVSVAASAVEGQLPTDAMSDSQSLTDAQPSGDSGELEPTADPRLQPDYPGAYGPGGLVLPTSEPPPPDNGAPPSWLPAGLSPWWGDIAATAHANGLDSHAWAAIVSQENPWGDPNATSPAGARGLGQLMPATAADIEAKTGLDTSTPTGNLAGGAWYYAERVRDNADLWTEGNDEPALLAGAAAYNGGDAPRQDVRRAAQAGADDLCAGVRYAETKIYCIAFRDRWRATLAERGTAPGEPGSGPALLHLEAGR